MEADNDGETLYKYTTKRHSETSMTSLLSNDLKNDTKDYILAQPFKTTGDYFSVFDDNTYEVIDTKGCPDSVAILKRKLFWYQYPTVDYKWVCYSKIDGGWCDYEYVKKQRAERKRNKKL